MMLIIDRFEGNYAVCEKEDRSMMNIPREKIPSDAKEGDVLLIENDQITIDHEATVKRRNQIAELVKGMWKN